MKKTWRDSKNAHKFYHSTAWKKTRQLVLDRAHGLCEKCSEQGLVKPADVVHHVKPLSDDNFGDLEQSLNPDNLIALCHECHTRIHEELGVGALNGEKEKPRVGFDEDGNVVRL